MRKNNSISIATIVLWSFILIAALGAFAYFMGGRNMNRRYGTYQDVGKMNVVKEEKFSNIKSLKVDYANGDIVIKENKGSNDIRVIEKRYADYNEETLFIPEVTGSTLKIKDGRSRQWGIFNFNFGFTDTPYIEIYLPEKLYNLIDINTASGYVDISNLKANDINIDAASGDFRLEDVETDSIKLDIASGNIDSKNLKADTVDINAMSGDVNLKGSIKEFEFDGASGNLNLKSDIMVRKFKVDMASGNAKISIPDNDGFTMRLDKLSGSFNSDFTLSQTGDVYIYKNGAADYHLSMASGNVNLLMNEK